MLLWNLQRMFAERGIVEPLAWMRRHGISYDRGWKLLEGEASEIKIEQLHELCNFLYCTPNDIFTWKADKDPLPADHPLTTLEKDSNKPPIAEQIQILSPAELRLLQKVLDEMKRLKNNPDEPPEGK